MLISHRARSTLQRLNDPSDKQSHGRDNEENHTHQRYYEDILILHWFMHQANQTIRIVYQNLSGQMPSFNPRTCSEDPSFLFSYGSQGLGTQLRCKPYQAQ